MTQPVFDPTYWSKRWSTAPESNRHHAVFQCSDVKWAAISERHRLLIAGLIRTNESVLDVGCGNGRLIGLMPEYWDARYLGVDLCPEFIREALANWTQYNFHCGDVRDLDVCAPFDWAVLISMRGMIVNNLDSDTWADVLRCVKERASRVLILEYSEDDEGEVL